MSCTIAGAPNFGCDDRKSAAGLKQYGYLGNLEDITFVRGADDLITSFTIASTKQLYKFTVPPKANDAGYEVQVGDAGNPSFKYMLNAQFSASSQAQRKEVEDLVYATNTVAFIVTNGNIIEVLGAADGLSIESGTQTSGKLGTDNNLHQISLSGEGNEIPPQYLATDFDTSIAALEAALIPA